MPNLEYINTLNSSSVGSAIEVTVSNIASPTELNSRAAIQGDLVLARTTEAGTGAQTLYYADTTSDAELLPYIVSSATAGIKFIAFGGRYSNQENTSASGFTAPHMRALSSAGLLLENSNGDDVALLGAGPGTGATFYGGVVFSSTMSVIDTNFSIIGSADSTKSIKFEVDSQTANDTLTIDTGAQTDSRTATFPVLTGNSILALSNATFTSTRVPYATTNGILTDSANLTFSGTLLTLASSSGNTLKLNSTTASTSTSTGSLQTSGGVSAAQQSFFRGVASSGDVSALAVEYYHNQSVDPAGFRSALNFSVSCSGATAGNSGQSVGIQSDFSNNVAGITHADVRAFSAIINTGNATAAITNSYGYYFRNGAVTGTTTSKHAFYTEAVTGGTNNYAFRSAGAGLVQIGDTTDSTTKDTGSIVTEGGLGVEKAIYAGTGIRSVSATAGIGYATGAGGTVAQGSGSGKATGVTLNTVCGTITMDGANLNADTTVAFTFTNSAIAATDLVVIQHSSVGTLGAYNFAVTPTAGSATVSVRNVTPGNLAEAIVLRFAIIKAVTS